MSNRLQDMYRLLLETFGPQHWWPGDTPLEIMVGAVLTQNTSWQNVEKAITNLREADFLSFDKLSALPPEVLAEQIRPCGYYNLKAGRLLNLLDFIQQKYDNLEDFLAQEISDLRRELLSVKGIGPETADSITLYAANQPAFVVDAYTVRVLIRHQFLAEEEADYHFVRDMFMESLPLDTALFNEYHALLVRLGKDFCRKSKPRCAECPLKDF